MLHPTTDFDKCCKAKAKPDKQYKNRLANNYMQYISDAKMFVSSSVEEPLHWDIFGLEKCSSTTCNSKALRKGTCYST